MASEKNAGTFKRRYPKVGKCCCCCGSKESVMICTVIALLFEVYGILTSLINSSEEKEIMNTFNTFFKIIAYVSKVVSAAAIISYILLLFGISKVKFPFLTQFKIFYIFYLIYYIFSIIITGVLMFDDEYVNKIVEYTKKKTQEIYSTSYMNQSQVSDSQLRDTVKSTASLTILFSCFIFLLYLYYYLSTCTFIEDLEEKAIEEDETRNLEDNNY